MDACIITSPLGSIKIEGDRGGISSIKILESEESLTKVIPIPLKECTLQLQEYFQGIRKEFNLKLNPEGTPFQKQVWKQLEQIPYGKTVSYLDLAKQLGDAKAIRAVANANAKNLLWIVVPCHRVIGSNGNLTGYAGGLHRKAWLLNHENSSKQPSLFLILVF